MRLQLRAVVLTSLGAIAGMLDSLADELANVVDVLGHVAPDTAAPVSAAPLDRAQLLRLLDQLDQGFAHGELVDGAFRALGEALPTVRMRPLQDAVDAFDFDAAREALADLRAWAAQEPAA